MRTTAIVLLLAACGLAQTANVPPPPPQSGTAPPQAAPAAPASPAPATPVSPSEAVVTVEGVCQPAPPARSPRSAKPGPCRTVITRAEFERLANALNPDMPPAVRQQLAQQYSRWLVMASEARKRGLDKTPRFRQVLEFMQKQALAQEFLRDTNERMANISEQVIASYYNDNRERFQQYTLDRIYIPRSYQVDGKPVEEAALKELVAKIRERAAAGEDFGALEKEIYTMGDVKMDPPSTSLGERRRGSLPLQHEKIFDLEPGAVSEPISDGSGFYIYKVEARHLIPLETARAEIQRTLHQQRMQDAMQELTARHPVTLNDAYFAAGQPPRPAPGPAQMGAPPPKGQPSAANPPILR